MEVVLPISKLPTLDVLNAKGSHWSVSIVQRFLFIFTLIHKKNLTHNVFLYYYKKSNIYSRFKSGWEIIVHFLKLDFWGKF